MEWKKPVHKINQAFFSEEPSWYWGLFVLLFSLITMRYVSNKDISIIHSHIYHALPLFDFFHIPNPYKAKNFLESFLPFSISLEAFFNSLKLVFIISLIFSFLGLFQKFFILLSLIGFFLFHGYFYGYIRTADDPKVYHSANIVCFILLIWLMAPKNSLWTAFFWIRNFFKIGKNWKIKYYFTYPKWPRLLVILTIGLAYFGSFYCKFMTSGFQWINGYTLQSVLLKAQHIKPLSYGGWLAEQNFYLIWFLNISVWLFQSTAFIGMFIKKTRLIYAVMGIVFHVGVLLFMGILFVPFHYFYVVFVPEFYLFFINFKFFIRKFIGSK